MATAAGIVTRPTSSRPSRPFPVAWVQTERDTVAPRASAAPLALGHARVEAVDRRHHRLEVVGAGALPGAPGDAGDERDHDRLDPRDGEIEVEVLAVGGVDAALEL